MREDGFQLSYVFALYDFFVAGDFLQPGQGPAGRKQTSKVPKAVNSNKPIFVALETCSAPAVDTAEESLRIVSFS